MPPKLPYDTDALVKQSKAMLAQTQAEGTKAFAGSSFDTNRTGAVAPITSASMAPVAPIDVQTTTPTPAPVVAPYEPQLDAEEKQAETQQTGYQDLIASLTAETSAPFQQEARLKQEQAQDIAGKKAKLASFQNINKALEAEAQGIDLQLAQDIQGLQNMAQQGGANVTKGGLAPQQRALQTQANQAKLAVAIKQYSNNASMAAAQGDLSSAIDYVDRAIQAEFLPKEKALAVAQANLTNLQNSGVLTRAQQKRADARQAQIDDQKEALATEKKNKETIEGIILQAVQNGAPQALIQQARKGATVFDVAQELSGWTAKETAQSIQEYNFAVKNGYKGSYSQYQNEDANRKAAIAKAGVKNEAGLTPYQVFTATQALAKDNQKRTENAREISRQVSIMDTAYKNYTSGGDKNVATQAIIATFNKILDPTSVVRESEYDRTAAGQALISRIQGKYENIAQGGAGVTAETLKSAVDLGNQYLKNAQESILAENKRSSAMAQQFGLDAGLVSTVATPQEALTPQKQVEQAVQSSGKTYQQIISAAPAGQIAVVQDGIAGYIPVEEFDPNTQVRM